MGAGSAFATSAVGTGAVCATGGGAACSVATGFCGLSRMLIAKAAATPMAAITRPITMPFLFFGSAGGTAALMSSGFAAPTAAAGFASAASSSRSAVAGLA